jgi:L-amino acid N-acyltransferase
MKIREAEPEDLAAIGEIYNHYVKTSTCTYQVEPSTPSEMADWLAAHSGHHPATVAVTDDGTVVGYGSLSSFRDRFGYRFSVESSVYVRPDLHRRGIGQAILIDLVQRARTLGFKTIVAGISADETASLAIHRRHGFVDVALIKSVGHKFDRWLDLVFLQLMLR